MVELKFKNGMVLNIRQKTFIDFNSFYDTFTSFSKARKIKQKLKEAKNEKYKNKRLKQKNK